MNILIIGDVISKYGCDFLRHKLPEIKHKHSINFVIANGENSAIGNGILPQSAHHMFESGVDVITSGNHVFKRREIYNFLDQTNNLIRPANFPADCPGYGYVELTLNDNLTIAVINLIGTVFLEPMDSPFHCIDKIINKITAKIIIVDFHAEATSEKLALAHYVDGRVTAVVGTHTHVQTSDHKILPKSTAYITDVGMVGSKYSVLGIEPECVIRRITTKMPVKFKVDPNNYLLNSVVVKVDDNTSKAYEIFPVNIE